MRYINRSVVFTMGFALAACGGGEGDSADSGNGGEGNGAAEACTVEDNGDGTATITCGDTTAEVSGPAGEGCSAVDNGDGTWALTCPDGSTINVQQTASFGVKGVGQDLGTLDLYLFVKGADGKALTASRINPAYRDGGGLSTFQISPDKRHIAFLQEDDTTGLIQLYVSNLEGDKPTKIARVNAELATGGAISSYVWSPDGSKLAYLGDQDVDSEVNLYVVSVSEGKVSGRVMVSGTPDATTISQPTFSADGEQIAFLRATGPGNELYVAPVEADATPDKVNGTLAAATSVVQFGIAGNGTKIGYLARQGAAAVPEFFVADLEDGVAATAKKASGSTQEGAGVTYFAFSPNSERAVYFADQAVLGESHLYVTDVSGSTPTSPKAVDDFTAAGDALNYFFFSTDSERLVFVGYEDAGDRIDQVYSSDISGSTPSAAVVLNQELELGENVTGVQLSARNRVFYLTDAGHDGYNELFSVDVAGEDDPSRINAALGTAGTVLSYALSASGTHLAYLYTGTLTGAAYVDVTDGTAESIKPVVVPNSDIPQYISQMPVLSNNGNVLWATSAYPGAGYSNVITDLKSPGVATNVFMTNFTFLDRVED